MDLKKELIAFVKANKNLRNPILTINGLKIGIIGDVHIGKTFRTGVPKDRLGERESMILSQLTELLNRDVQYTVIVGDLFDKVRVSNNDLYSLITIIENAATENSDKIFSIINGNHDMPKEVGRISSFQLFEKYFERAPLPNLKIISKHTDENIIVDHDHGVLLYLSHYNAFSSLDEELGESILSTELKSKIPHRIAFGHWETIDFGSDHFIDRDVPKNVLADFTAVVTGHEHKPKITIIEDIPVLTSGSMQPYSYGEELDYEKSFYRTVTTEEVKTLLKEDANIFKNSYVKILVESGDELPDAFTCLGRSYKNVTLPSTKVDKEDEQDSDEIADEPLSFQKSFLNIIKTFKESDESHSEFLDNIERTFLDKSYKETT